MLQIPSDFRVVTALEQQIDDLPFPWSYLGSNCSSMVTCTSPMYAAVAASGAKPKPLGTSGFGSLRLILHSRGQIRPEC
jgi:hypothetical protein